MYSVQLFDLSNLFNNINIFVYSFICNSEIVCGTIYNKHDKQVNDTFVVLIFISIFHVPFLELCAEIDFLVCG